MGTIEVCPCGKRPITRYKHYCPACYAKALRIRLGRTKQQGCPCGQPYAAHSIGEAAKILGVSRSAIQCHLRDWKHGIRIHGQWHFTEEELHKERKNGRPRKHG